MEYYKPLCSVLVSDNPLNAWICYSNWTFSIIFHCLTGTLNNTPPPVQPPLLLTPCWLFQLPHTFSREARYTLYGILFLYFNLNIPTPRSQAIIWIRFHFHIFRNLILFTLHQTGPVFWSPRIRNTDDHTHTSLCSKSITSCSDISFPSLSRPAKWITELPGGPWCHGKMKYLLL